MSVTLHFDALFEAEVDWDISQAWSKKGTYVLPYFNICSLYLCTYEETCI